MSRDFRNLFNLIVPEQLRQDAPLPAVTKLLAFDDLGDFIEERQRIQRKVELALETNIKVDFSNFGNHVFFDSATSKFSIAQNKILTQYPFEGSSEDRDLFNISASLYENYVLSQWPRSVGYANFSGTKQYITASDINGNLFLGSSSLYISAWLNPTWANFQFGKTQGIIQVLSGNTTGNGYGYQLSVLKTGGTQLNFFLVSGSSENFLFAPISSSLTASWMHVAGMYDQPAQLMYLFINGAIAASQSIVQGPINFPPQTVIVGSGSGCIAFSGSMDEVRILHTASVLFHQKNFNRPITAESYVKLNYRFNEGVVGTSSIDNVIIDYSKSALHGQYVNYASGSRASGSAMAYDPGDPILYSFHSGVMAFSASQTTSASIYDATNRNYILRLLPERILEDDQDANGLLISFSLAMARFYDELKMYVDQFDNLRVKNYSGVNETPDVMMPLLKKYFGWQVTDHFSDSNPLSFFFGENVLAPTGSLSTFSLQQIRDQFWTRILNNLPYLYKTKGKRNNIETFFNVLGVNSNLINLKEYGFLKKNSITDDLINKQKPFSVLGFGTGSVGSTSSSFVVVPHLLSGTPRNEWTVETFAQFPWASSSFSGTILTGSIWEMVSGTSGFAFLWNVPTIGSSSGSLILSGTDGQKFSASGLPIFNGQFIQLAAGLAAGTAKPFIEYQILNNTTIAATGTFTGSIALSGVFTGSSYDFVMGATSGSAFSGTMAQGYFGQYRYWTRQLSASEVASHTFNPESIGTQNPLELPNPLLGQWPLNENIATTSAGTLNAIDLSRNGNYGSGSNFPANINPFNKFLLSYNFLSPSADLKWTQNKIRIRNESTLAISEIANDTNEVVLEFNLIDALNEDIAKIFSTIGTLNNSIGAPINKYRDGYEDLEALRRVYFARLGDSLNFTGFFKLFQWFDRKLANSIKQLLPARVDFIGGEFVVESHFLERNKYQLKYPVFKTPKNINVGDIGQVGTNMSQSAVMKYLSNDNPMQGMFVQDFWDKQQLWPFQLTPKLKSLTLAPRRASVVIDGIKGTPFTAKFSDGDGRVDRNLGTFFRLKYSGDTPAYTNNPAAAINFKNETARALRDKQLLNNVDGNRSGSLMGPGMGNGFVMTPAGAGKNAEAFHGLRTVYPLVIRGLSGSGLNLSSSIFSLVGANGIELSQSLWDTNNNQIDTGSFINQYFNLDSNTTEEKYVAEMTFFVSGSAQAFNAGDIVVKFRDGNSTAWATYQSVLPYGAFLASGLNDGWYKFDSRFFINGFYAPPRFSFNRTNVHWFVSSSTGKTYAFKEFKVTFAQAANPQNFATLDNQYASAELSSLNRNLMPNLEDGVLRERSYFGWQTLNKNSIVNSSGTLVPASITAMARSGSTIFAVGSYLQSDATNSFGTDYPDVSGTLGSQQLSIRADLFGCGAANNLTTAGGATYFNSFNFTNLRWFVIRSLDAGKSWLTVDDWAINSGSYLQSIWPSLSSTLWGSQANAVVIDMSGNVHVGGFAPSNTNPPLLAHHAVIRSSYNNGQTWQDTLRTNGSIDFPGAATGVSGIWSGNQYDASVSSMDMDLNGNVYAAINYCGGASLLNVNGAVFIPGGCANASVRKTTTGLSGSWNIAFNMAAGFSASCYNQMLAPLTIRTLKASKLHGEKIFFCGVSSSIVSLLTFPSASETGYVAYFSSSFSSGSFSLQNALIASKTGSAATGVSSPAWYSAIDDLALDASDNIVYSTVDNTGQNAFNPTNTGYTKLFVTGSFPSWPNAISASFFGNYTIASDNAARANNGIFFKADRKVLAVDSSGLIYFCQQEYNVGPVSPQVTAITGTRDGRNFTRLDIVKNADSTYFTPTSLTTIANPGKNDTVYLTADNGLVIAGQLSSNSASLGPRMLATSIGFNALEISGTDFNGFKLNNISEFPHYGGAFQMRNMIIGTRDTGKIGPDDRSIVQVRHIGSVVQVFWPSQASLDAAIAGNGEMSIGQSPGNLQTAFAYGDLMNASGFDHLALYCYIQKNTSGTLDDVVVAVQRRPLGTVGFVTDQTVDYSISGTFTEARYRDILHTKGIDYGDLTIPSISYVIDVPLVNVSQVRVGARLKNGQAVPNQNFLIWGRLINSKVET